jgi:hypothetical protein
MGVLAARNAAITALLLAGCATTSGGAPHGSAAQRRDPTVRAIRAVVDADARVYSYTLWHDRLPSWARASPVGSALRALAHDAAERRRERVRIKLLSATIQMTALRISQSRTEATVRVTERARTITYRSGHPRRAAAPVVSQVVMQLRRPSLSSEFRVTAVVSNKVGTSAADSLATA